MINSNRYIVHAIVLKRKNVGETDKLLTIFTKEQGKLRVIAKGVRKITSKRAPYLELFQCVVLTLYHGRTLDSVIGAEQTGLGHMKAQTVDSLTASYVMTELVDRLMPDGQQHREVFELLARAFGDVQNISRDRIDSFLASFCRTLFILLGYLPSDAPMLDLPQYVSFAEGLTERKLRTVKLMAKIR